MNENLGSISQTKDDIEKLISLKIDKFKLQGTNALAILFSKILVTMLMLMLLVILIGILVVGVSIFIGELLGSYTLGMLISAGIVLFIILILYLFRNKLFLNSMTKLFVKLIFSENDNAK